MLVGAIVLVDLMFYAAITPLLPWYVERFDLSKTGAGILAGSYAAGTLLASLPSGWIAIRIGARRTVLIGLGLLAASSVGFAFGQTIAMLDAMRFLQGVGGACTFAGGFGWLISFAPPEQRGATIGKALSAALFGLLLGPVLGAIAREIGPELPFTAIGALALVLALATVRLPAPASAFAVQRPLATALGSQVIRFGMLLVIVPSTVFGAVEVLGPLELDRLGATGIAIAATFLVAAGLEAIAQLLVGRATDRHGRIWPLRIGFAGTLLFMVLLPLPSTVLILAVVVVTGCVIAGALNTPAMTLLSDGVDAAGLDHGFGFALVNLVWAGGHVVGAVGGGALATASGDVAVYLVLAAACAAMLGVLARTRAPTPVRDYAAP